MDKTSNLKEGIEKYTLTPFGITNIFKKLSEEKASPNDKILLDINLQFSGEKKDAIEHVYYTLSDCHNHFKYFIFKNPPFSLQAEEIINIKEISYNYESNKQFFSLNINEYEIKSKALYQIYPYTTLFNANKFLNIFTYFKKKPIDYLQYNVLSNLSTLPKKLTFYVRVISKVTLTSFTKNKEKKHDGNYFYFDVVDLNNDTVRITATYSNANYYYYRIKINSIYVISGNFYLNELTRYQEHNKANPLYKYYKDLKAPKKEIYLGNDSKVTEMDDNEDSNLISVDENKYIIFSDIYTILNQSSTFVDLVNTIGVVIKVGSCFKVTYARRKIQLLDDSNYIIDVYIWNQYTLYPIKLGDILLIKNIQVKKNEDKKEENINKMTTVDETEIYINPDTEKTKTLKLIYEQYIKNKPKKVEKNSEKNNNNCSIMKYFNNFNLEKENIKGKTIFVKDINNLKNNINNNVKGIFGYINKIVYDKIEDIVNCVCISCLSELIKKGIFWYCLKCKKTLMFPSYLYKDIILNIVDSTWNINIIVKKEKIKDIFGVSPEKMNNLKEIKKIENQIQFKLYYFSTKFKFDDKGNLIVEDFNQSNLDEIKNSNLPLIKDYIKLLNNS